VVHPRQADGAGLWQGEDQGLRHGQVSQESPLLNHRIREDQRRSIYMLIPVFLLADMAAGFGLVSWVCWTSIPALVFVNEK
jgi:hypothetical protein